MKAIAINAYDTEPRLLDVPDPRAGEGEVVCNVEYASVNGMDMMVWKGYMQGMMQAEFPITLGRDFSGTVASVGAGVTTLKAGDPVFGALLTMVLHDGTFAPQVKVAATSVAKRPAGLDAKTAGALALAGGAAKSAIDAVKPARGETVLICGATGGVGPLAIQMAKQRGAKVIATATPAQAGFLREFGADEIVDHTGDLAAAVRKLHPDGVDVVFHFAGDAVAQSALLKSGGRLASLLGASTEQLQRKDVTATPVMTLPSPDLLGDIANAAASGQLKVPITKTYSLDQAGQALKDFATGATGKFLIAVR